MKPVLLKLAAKPAAVLVAGMACLVITPQPLVAAAMPAESACDSLSSAPTAASTVGGSALLLFQAVSDPATGWGIVARTGEDGMGSPSTVLWDSRKKTQPTQVTSLDREGWPVRLSTDERERLGQLRRKSHTDASQYCCDQVLAQPLFVAAPRPSRWGAFPERTSYPAFAAAQTGRAPMVYASNDRGWLVGLDAASGEERFLLVPEVSLSSARAPASAVTTASQRHVLSAGAAFFAGTWHTVLLGAFGPSVYALDLTESADGAARPPPARLLLWEFTENDAAGVTYSQPTLVRMRDGTWAAIFGSGPGAQPAALYIVDVATGRLVKKIATPPTKDVPRWDGLSTPAAADLDGDGSVDHAYAGDVHGNLWKFDLTASVPAGWGMASADRPLFRAIDANGRPQPIVTRPEIVRGAAGLGATVLFGAGPDPTHADAPRDIGSSFYAIWDRQEAVDRSQLRERRIVTVDRVRHLQELPPRPEGSSHKGWYLDLPAGSGEPPERFISHPAIRYSDVLFRTQQLATGCQPALTWTMAVPVQPNGSRTGGLAPNGNETQSASTAVGVARGAYPAATLSFPAILESRSKPAECMQAVYFSNGIQIEPPAILFCEAGSTGRQSWRQLR